MKEDRTLNDELLKKISGGKSQLPENWEKIADQIAPYYAKLYKGATFAQACELIKSFFSDPGDQEKVIDYVKNYYITHNMPLE